MRRVGVKHENVRFAVRQAVLHDEVIEIRDVVHEYSALHKREVSGGKF